MVKLKELREARNVRPELVAGAAGVSVRTLANYEQGITVPPVNVARKIAAYFGIPESEFEWGQPSDADEGKGARAAVA